MRILKVACLPLAGIENPYQLLMIEGLSDGGKLHAFHGAKGKLFAFIRTVISLDPDYIHIDWLHPYYLRKNGFLRRLQMLLFLLDVLLVTNFTRVKLVWSLHNILPHDEKTVGFELFIRKYFASLCHWIRVFGQGSVHKAMEKLNIGANKIIVLPEGNYIDYYPNNITKEAAREYLKLTDQHFVLLFIGSLRPYKGILELIDSFNRCKQENWKLIIAGDTLDTKYMDKISKKILNNQDIQFYSHHVESNRIQYFMNAANIVVLPYLEIENSGSVILAMGFKKAVIAPRKGLISERLWSQPELIYDGPLDAILIKLQDFNEPFLQQLGEKNFLDIMESKWSSFQKLFH
ncbi:MAG: glycosyltransferase [Bacteroidota bacterium]|nr:glycosyltransferase [Bacteroidota bacterium]